MGIDTLFYDLDETKIKVIAGDLSEGYWELRDSVMRRMVSNSTESESIDLNAALESAEFKNLLSKDSAEPLMGAGVGALLGLRFGIIGAGIGAVAGHLLMTGPQRASVQCKLSDGRNFIAVMSPKIYDQIKIFARVRERSEKH